LSNIDTPASWRSLHQATLHYLVTNVINYFLVIHDTTEQRRDLLNLITELLGLSPIEPTALSAEPASASSLFDQAVAELVAQLHLSSFSLADVDDPLLRTLCDRYYSPIFGRSVAEFREEVHSSYRLP
jgi:hypothetical protein